MQRAFSLWISLSQLVSQENHGCLVPLPDP
jgi:hypothetical protein